MTLYATKQFGVYYINSKIRYWYEALWVLGRGSIRSVAMLPDNSQLSTPVYGYYETDEATHEVKLKYTDDASELKCWIRYIAIPAVYAMKRSKRPDYKYQIDYKLTVKDIISIFLNDYTVPSYSSRRPMYHKSHTAWTNSGIKYKRLLTFYSKANSEDYRMRHNSRYTSWRKKYAKVLDWDGVAHRNSAGWKTKKKRHQWE
jgi:hypothetical protein